mmetsp:Transcript_50523/g.57942  ORF Transcript_50523/g.57942 Transcript_50523/m.57942 type:complete len:238 (+) Transcript_50523:666-1379(+)
MEKLHNSLSNLSIIFFQSFSVNTFEGDIESISHLGDGQFFIGFLPGQERVETRLGAGVLDGNGGISDIMDTGDQVMQFMGNTQEESITGEINQSAGSDDRLVGVGSFIDSKVQVGEDNLGLSSTRVDVEIITVNTTVNLDITSLTSVLLQVSFDLLDISFRQADKFSNLLVVQVFAKKRALRIGDLPEQILKSIQILLVQYNFEVERMIILDRLFGNHGPLNLSGDTEADQSTDQEK